MPTANRPVFARRAVEHFLAQDYPLCELVIVDDGRVDLNLPVGHGIVYERFNVKRDIGTKRNVACSLAAGDVIVHWDDDDIYHQHRISDQVERLLANPQAEMTGYHSMEFVDQHGARYMFEGPEDYAIGVSFCYWKQAWRERAFAPAISGEDLKFWQGRRCVSVPANGMIVATIHQQNTSVKTLTDQGWRKLA